MAANHLEQLIAEWYEYQGYFIRRNVKVGKLKKGGWEAELDIVAFHPEQKHLIHIEPSLDADSWARREARYTKKFAAGRKYIPDLFKGLELPATIEQLAVLVFAATAKKTELAGGRIMLLPELLEAIFAELHTKSILTNMVDEQKPLLRTLQFVAQYRHQIFPAK